MAKKKEGSKFVLALGVGLVAVTLFAFNFLAQTASSTAENMVVEMQISPNTLVKWGRGEWVVVHADVARSEVVGSTLRLNKIGVEKTRSDAVGNLVAYFDHDRIRDSLTDDQWASESAGLVMTGDLWDGGELAGIDEVILKLR